MESQAVREPSFWFFFLTAIYFLWRAAVEVDWRLFVVGGIATALTCLTRFEGWFLLLPLCGWALVRFCDPSDARWRLAGGWACSLVAIPIVFYAFGHLLPESADWNHVRLDPVERAGHGCFPGRLKEPGGGCTGEGRGIERPVDRGRPDRPPRRRLGFCKRPA